MILVGADEIKGCYGLMRQLRPHLSSEREFVERWRSLSGDGYRLLALFVRKDIKALAGFQRQESFVHGAFLYVNDLVTDASDRGRGYGTLLMERLKTEGRALGCRKLVLDSGLENALGHRFYYRQGLLASALRFSMPLESELSGESRR